MNRNLFFILLLLGSALAGCVQPSEPAGPWETWSPRFGLGLNITEIPPPGQFIEDAADIDRLAHFLNTTGRDKLRDCRMTDFSSFNSLLTDRYYLAAVETVLWQCYGQWSTQQDRQAQYDHDHGLAEAEIRKLLARGPADLNASIAAINGFDWPANAVDLEVLGRAMKLVMWADSSWRTVPQIVDDYLQKRERVMIEGLYANLYIPQNMVGSVQWFVANYPWAPPNCDVDGAELHELRSRAWLLLNETIGKAERLRPPSETVDLSTNYGRLTQDFKPSMEFADRHGWWPATLWYYAIISWSNSYWDHRYDQILPSQEEAWYLMAKYLNESRNLIRDDEIAKMQGNIPYREWEMDTGWASLSLAMADFDWTYGNLRCRSEPA